MATSEPTISPKDLLLPVSMEEFCKWSDIKDIHLSGLEDLKSDEDTAGTETSHTHDFQPQDNPGLFPKQSSMESSRHSKSLSSIEEPALTKQKGQNWFSLPKFRKRREQYRVESKSPPIGKSKSLSSSQQSHKSQPSKGGEYSPSIINLATITDQVDVPPEVRIKNSKKVVA